MAVDNHIEYFGQAQIEGHDELMTLPKNMSASDKALFDRSLEARSSSELAKAALLWEDYFLPKYPSAFFLIRVGDVHTTLGSPTTALPLYIKAKDKLKLIKSVTKDEDFLSYLEEFHDKVDKWVTEQAEVVQRTTFNEVWRPARERRFPTNLYAPPAAAENIRFSMYSPDLWRKFTNLLLIETNQIDRSLLLTRASAQDILDRGILEGNIEPTHESRLLDKDMIKEVLKDTLAAYEKLFPIVRDTSLLTPAAIKDIHATLMKNSRIDMKSSKYVNAGTTRTETKKSVFIKGEVYNVQCCPPDQVDGELEYICNQARQWIRTWGDKRSPFAVAAWLHVLLAQCHPFEDGNGGLARFIASIPLLRQDFPAICISTNFAGRYYAATKKAYGGNFDDLAHCFVDSTANSIHEVVHGR